MLDPEGPDPRVPKAESRDTNRGGRKPTMHDVAREAGVSIGTVDRVFHERGRFSRETAQQVYAAAEMLRYEPNRAASNLSRSRSRRFVALMPELDADGGYWRQAAEGMTTAVAHLDRQYIDLEFVTYDRFSPSSFRHSAEAARDSGARGVILAPTNAAAAREFAASLRDLPEEVPIVVFDGELPDTSLLTTISQDSYESGVLAGKLLDWITWGRVAEQGLVTGAPRIRFLSITLGRDDFHLRARRRGFEDYAGDKHEVDLRHVEIDGAEVAPALAEALPADGRNAPHATGIFVTNSAAHQVVEALSRRPSASFDRSSSNRPAVVGYDLVPANTAALRDGYIDALFNQQPQQQGLRAVYALYRHVVLGEPVASYQRIPMDLVVRETVGIGDSKQDGGEAANHTDETQFSREETP